MPFSDLVQQSDLHDEQTPSCFPSVLSCILHHQQPMSSKNIPFFFFKRHFVNWQKHLYFHQIWFTVYYVIHLYLIFHCILLRLNIVCFTFYYFRTDDFKNFFSRNADEFAYFIAHFSPKSHFVLAHNRILSIAKLLCSAMKRSHPFGYS